MYFYNILIHINIIMYIILYKYNICTICLQKPQMERYLSLLQLSRYVGIHDLMDSEQKLKLADRLLRCYHKCEIFNNSKRSSEIM